MRRTQAWRLGEGAAHIADANVAGMRDALPKTAELPVVWRLARDRIAGGGGLLKRELVAERVRHRPRSGR
jgi:hypothetical protein